MLIFALALAVVMQATPPGEEPVDPYPQGNANAGAVPFKGEGILDAFHGRAGIDRVVDTMVARNVVDPRISDIFKNQDLVRLRRTLKEQFCYILNGGCDYSGRAMRDAHRNMGLQVADMAALIENLQTAMTKEGVPFFAQNRFLAKLAPMKRVVVER
jgi:hemoglobin